MYNYLKQSKIPLSSKSCFNSSIKSSSSQTASDETIEKLKMRNII